MRKKADGLGLSRRRPPSQVLRPQWSRRPQLRRAVALPAPFYVSLSAPVCSSAQVPRLRFHRRPPWGFCQARQPRLRS